MYRLKRCFFFLLLFMVVFSLMPSIALAAAYAPSDGDTFDLSACAAGDTVTIGEGLSVTLTGTCTNVRVTCGPNATLTLDDVTIANTTFGHSPLKFTGQGNRLIVTGDNTLTGARNAAAVLTTDAAVTISGEGKLTANGASTGTLGCAGIGGNGAGNGGSITIESGTIVARAGANGKGVFGYAGIAGAVTISGGTVTAIGDKNGSGITDASGTGTSVTIKGGNVTAYSNVEGVGIGSYGVKGGSGVNILGGNVTAYCIGGGGAGIGDPKGGTTDVITITGGTVTAYGGYARPGISGNVTISGGTVYSGGNMGSNDLGDTSLAISGGAAIFLRNDRIASAITEHTHLTYAEDTESVYGYAIPAEWAPPFGAYLHFVTLSYDKNGGSGTAADAVTQLYGSQTTLSDGSGLSLTGYEFSGWNTAAGGSGTAYEAGDTFTLSADTTLYAQWTPKTYTIAYNLDGGTLTSANPESYTIESGDIALNNPYKEGYTFAGWSGTGITGTATNVTIPAGSAGNRAYTANWTPITYTISYNLDGGTLTSANPESYTMESGDIALNNPSKDNYTFAGWSGTGITGTSVTVTIPSGSAGNRAYTANWTPVTYTISYNLDGGTLTSANPESYTIESEDIALNNPSKDNYTFAGWSGTGITGTSVNVTILSGSAGNRAYTANWTAVPVAELPQTHTMYTGGRVTWDPQPAGGTWDWDETFFSATFNGSATFTALKTGVSTITYTVNGISQSITITVEKAELPNTGQDFTLIYVLGGVCVLSVAAGAVLLKAQTGEK